MSKHFGFIHNDPDTIEVLDATQVPRKAIQGSPWYQILSNQKYANQFYYVGAFVGEREKLIEDGFGESKKDSHSQWERRIRCEQSDMIMILLNLAFIPDHIVHKEEVFDSFKPGWCHRLEKAMQEDQNNFNKNVEDNKQLRYHLMRPVGSEGKKSTYRYVEEEELENE